MSIEPTPHARLHVLMARDAPTAVVLRRGPARQVCSILWDRRRDTFTTGQWYAGRIYERSSDIAPDGGLWIYFARKGKWEAETTGAYTVVARPPYLKALGLWPMGDETSGGGLFSRSGRYWPFHDEPLVQHPELPPASPGVVRARWYDGVIYTSRLVRDGWQPVNDQDKAHHYWPRTLEKRAFSHWLLRQVCDVRSQTFELVHGPTKRRLDLLDWEWADVDGERLVWAEAGSLWEGRLDHSGLIQVHELKNFDAMRFRRLRAPY